MTAHSDIDEYTVDNWSNPDDVVEAVCEECGTPARFETRYDHLVGDSFAHHCYSCGSGRFPGLGSTTQFRVTDLSPDLEIHPVSPNPPPVYSSDDAD